LNRQPVEEHLIGIAFERDLLMAALVDPRGKVLAGVRKPTPRTTRRAVAAAMAEIIVSLACDDSRGRADISAIGISAPGRVDPTTGRISIPDLSGWSRVNLKSMIEQMLTDHGLDIRRAAGRRSARAAIADSAHPPITINSRARCMAAGESWIGAAKGRSNIVCLAIGEEIEAGILVDGRPLTGISGLAGALDWFAVTETWKNDYRDHGSLGAEVSAPGITRKAIESWSSKPDTLLGKLIKEDASRLGFDTIIRSARADDALAQAVINDVTGWLGRAIAGLIAVLNPEAVVLSGPVGIALKPYLDEIRDEASRWAHPDALDDCRISISTLGDKAVLPGAARLAAGIR